MISGGDIHFVHQLLAAVECGFDVQVFGGHALAQFIRNKSLPARVILTDKKEVGFVSVKTLGQQMRLFVHYCAQFFRTLAQLCVIKQADVAVAVTDAWFDVLPAVFSKATRKVMLLGMNAPTVAEILFRRRPDVTASRLTSLHYWLSQSIALVAFRYCKTKRVMYVHPDMRPRLLKLGFAENEITFVSNGIDFELAQGVPEQPKTYDVIWIGRVHPQKGIDDLIKTIGYLAERVESFRAVLVGNVEAALRPLFDACGLSNVVEFAGFVPEEEKLKFFKRSRVFLMPSRYESWGIVIGEALACGVPVVAYDIDAYRPIFGEYLRYVPPFNLKAFQQEAESQILQARSGKTYLDGTKVDQFNQENSWTATRGRIAKLLRELESTPSAG